MSAELIVVLCTAPDEAVAETLAKGLIDTRLAACVNAVPGIRSFYRWRGKVESETEVQLIIKTRPTCFEALAAWIESNHPYEVPEIIALPAHEVSESYLQWAIMETS